MNENPLYVKLNRINSKVQFATKIVKAFYLGGTVYSDENHARLLQAVRESSLNSFLENNPYDTQEDNIELYWIEDDRNDTKIIVVLDFLELYESERILHVLPSTNHFVKNVNKAEQINP